MASTCSEWPFDRWSSLKLVHNPSCPLPIWIDICHMSVYIYICIHTYIHIHIYTQDPHIYSNSNCSKNNDPSYPSYLFAIVALSILSTQNIINIYIICIHIYIYTSIYICIYIDIYIYAHVHIYRERERDPPKQETLPPSARHRLVASRFKEHGTEEPLQP